MLRNWRTLLLVLLKTLARLLVVMTQCVQVGLERVYDVIQRVDLLLGLEFELVYFVLLGRLDYGRSRANLVELILKASQ